MVKEPKRIHIGEFAHDIHTGGNRHLTHDFAVEIDKGTENDVPRPKLYLRREGVNADVIGELEADAQMLESDAELLEMYWVQEADWNEETHLELREAMLEQWRSWAAAHGRTV